MTYFKISAPGRIVLFGELAVMYGKHVLLASLNHRTTLEFFRIPDEEGMIKIDFPDVYLSLNVSLNEVVKFFSVGEDTFRQIIANHTQFLKLLQAFVTSNGLWRTRKQRFSLEIFFFLLLHISSHEHLDITPFHVRVSTKLPIGAGLGSSSSFAVCLAACFLHWSRLQRGAHSEFNEVELDRISAYAAIAEKVVQNRVYETDNNVCTYGKIGEFRYFNLMDSYSFTIVDLPVISILLVNLKIQRKMGEHYERAVQIAEQKYYFPELMDDFLKLCDGISLTFLKTLRLIKTVHERRQCVHDIKEIYAKLQNLLGLYTRIQSDLNMLHPKLVHMNLTFLNHEEDCIGKFAGYKGSFAYLILPPDMSVQQIINFSTFLLDKGFDIEVTTVSCKGVTID